LQALDSASYSIGPLAVFRIRAATALYCESKVLTLGEATHGADSLSLRSTFVPLLEEGFSSLSSRNEVGEAMLQSVMSWS